MGVHFFHDHILTEKHKGKNFSSGTNTQTDEETRKYIPHLPHLQKITGNLLCKINKRRPIKLGYRTNEDDIVEEKEKGNN